MDAQGTISLSLLEKHQEKTGETCSIFRAADGTERREDCYPQYKSLTDFWGVQQVSVTQA